MYCCFHYVKNYLFIRIQLLIHDSQTDTRPLFSFAGLSSSRETGGKCSLTTEDGEPALKVSSVGEKNYYVMMFIRTFLMTQYCYPEDRCRNS